MKKWLGLILTGALILSALSGCGPRSASETETVREQVTVALWSDQLTERYADYLQQSFPEVDFTFYVATNSADFYRFKEERGDLPDILTLRRFALRDMVDWKDSLLDLSTTELVAPFSQTYLRSYTYEDGTVNWLPACAEVDGIVVNKTLLEDNGLALPSTYQEFIELCAALTEKGIQPFRSNFDADYTCMELLQGLSSTRFVSQSGREWRRAYESGKTDQLSEEVWLPAFQRLSEFLRETGITPDNMESSSAALYEALGAGEVAMIRGTPGEIRQFGLEDTAVFLPFLGEQPEDSWYLTYPAFQVAARAVEDPERRQLIEDIMAAMLDETGLQNIAGSEDLIPYNRTVGLSLSPLLENMRPYIYANRLYIRLASAEMFSVSQTVVQGMIDGTYPNARAALTAFNDLMGEEKTQSGQTVHLDTDYPYAFDREQGSQAASAVLNSLREEVDTDLLLAPATAVAGNVTAGSYREEELGFLTMGETPVVILCEMTGTQLTEYVDYVLTTPGKRGSVVNDSTLYVSSGFEMTLARTDAGYRLEALSIEGRALDPEGRYRVAVLGNMETMVGAALDHVGVTSYTRSAKTYKQLIVDRLLQGRALARPTDYITLR